MKLISMGAGGYGRVVAELAEQTGKYNQILFLDDNSTDEKVIGKCEAYECHIAEDTEFYVAFGANAFRMNWLNTLMDNGANIATIIHPTAYVSPTAKIGVGSAVLPKAIVNTNTVVNKGVIVNCGAAIDHDCIIGDGVHVCLNAVVKAENNIPELLKIEACTVIENRQFPIK